MNAALGTRLAVLVLVWVPLAVAQTADVKGDGPQAFDSPKAATDALLKACKDNDTPALIRMFGPRYRQATETIDDAEEKVQRQRFWEKAQAYLKLDEREGERVVLIAGTDHWAFPIPLVKSSRGWAFATDEGFEELLARRIGGNELMAIDVCREYIAAQREYAAVDRDGDGVLEYAQRLRSSPGAHDGLYWPADEKAGEPVSPFGPSLARAEVSPKHADPRGSYLGYRYRILLRQGANVPGGAYGYVINGNMIAGFALVAWPETYRASGVMTFVVSHQGKIYEKDLGDRTESIAESMEVFEPDDSWKVVP
jgi:hypothetical protein